MKRKISAMLLASAITLSGVLAACDTTDKTPETTGQTTTTTSTTAEASGTETDTETDPETDTTPASETDELSEPMTISVASYLFGPIENDTITPLVEERLREEHGLNVIIENVYVEQDQYSEIINTRIVGDTEPDVFLAGSASNLQTYYDQSAIASWDIEFFQEHAPDVYAFIMGGAAYGDLADQTEDWLNTAQIDGQMVTVPSFKPDGSMPYKTLIYRGDFLEGVGVSQDDLPTTIEGFADLMKQFATEDPDGNGADDTYGMSITGMKAVFGAYGMFNGFSGGNSYWYEEDGVVYNADVSDGSKEALSIIADLYEAGAIDPEFSSGSEAISGSYWAISNGLLNGRYGASALASIDHFRLKEVLDDDGGPVAMEYWAVNGEDSEFVYAPWPAGPEGEYGYAIGEAVSVGESAIYSKRLMEDTDKLAMIFKVLNAFAIDDELMMLAKYGIEDEHYTMTDAGSVTMNESYDPLNMNATGIAVTRSLYGGDRSFSETSYDLAFYNDKSIKNRLDWFEEDQYDSYIRNAVTTTLPSAADYMSELNTLRDETYIAIITGTQSIDTWDDYVETYMSYGGQILFEEANEWFSNR